MSLIATPPANCPTFALEPHAARVTEAIQRARLTARFPLASTHVCEPMDEWSKCSNRAENCIVLLLAATPPTNLRWLPVPQLHVGFPRPCSAIDDLDGELTSYLSLRRLCSPLSPLLSHQRCAF